MPGAACKITANRPNGRLFTAFPGAGSAMFDTKRNLWQTFAVRLWKKEARMSVESHLAELHRRHEVLEKQIEEAMAHPGTDDLEITEMKRRKLQIKDEIARLSTAETVH
jgi:hypothetical protein